MNTVQITSLGIVIAMIIGTVAFSTQADAGPLISWGWPFAPEGGLGTTRFR
ncbi:MAG: hypothetical protein AAF468_13810 [Pseudomonadota bacterium]